MKQIEFPLIDSFIDIDGSVIQLKNANMYKLDILHNHKELKIDLCYDFGKGIEKKEYKHNLYQFEFKPIECFDIWSKDIEVPNDFFASNYDESSLSLRNPYSTRVFVNIPIVYAVINKKYLNFNSYSFGLEDKSDLKKVLHKYYNLPYYNDFINQLKDIGVNSISQILFDDNKKIFDMRKCNETNFVDFDYYHKDFQERIKEILTEYYEIQNFINDKAREREKELRGKR